MQPDEIIREKEWHQLTMQERKMLEELAATEQEFLLLKQMLQVTLEEKEQVPAVSEKVFQGLRAEFEKPRRTRSIFLPLLVAAAVVIAIALVYFLQANNNEKQTIDPIAKKQDPVPARKDPVHDSSTFTNDTIRMEEPVLSKKKTHPPQKHSQPKFNPPVDIPPATNIDVAVLNDQVGQDTTLLAYITKAF
jgi:hypothetical protein